MADQCIVCLDDLDGVPDATATIDLQDAGGAVAATPSTTTNTTFTTPHPGKINNAQEIALIKPCGHILHDECLRMWSQKANSCPICRHTFNLVEVLDKVGGTILSEYAVENKKQVADFDPNAWIEDNYEEEEIIPCPVCDQSDQEDVLLLCDACDAPYHTHCIGIDRIPNGQWFCMECAEDGAYARAAEPMQTARRGQPYSGRTQPRTQASVRRSRRMRTDHWFGAWSMFSTRVHDAVGLDLDFSEDDQYMAGYRVHQRRSREERRERENWERRLDIIGRLGGQSARDDLRNVAPILREQPPRSPVETQEETKAWSALEKAKELDTTSPRGRKRKAKSATASPAEPAESNEPERKLKRPRTRRIFDAGPSSAASPTMMSNTGSSSNRAGSPPRPSIDTGAEPSFLSSLLREVETATSDDDSSRAVFSASIRGPMRVTSPSTEYSSPAASPSPPSSNTHTPRAMSITPPPHITKRPGSPLPLTSRIEPMFHHIEYARNRSPPPEPHNHKPDVENADSTSSHHILELRQPRPRRRGPVQLSASRSTETSPARLSMTIEAKEGISKIVKTALAPHWKAAEITKEQYADINRDVSRKLYDIVSECGGTRHDSDIESTQMDENEEHQRLSERGKWEKIASQEVATAVKSLTA